MAGSRVLSVTEALRARSEPIGNGLYYGPRQSADGRLRMGLYRNGRSRTGRVTRIAVAGS